MKRLGVIAMAILFCSLCLTAANGGLRENVWLMLSESMADDLLQYKAGSELKQADSVQMVADGKVVKTVSRSDLVKSNYKSFLFLAVAVDGFKADAATERD